MTIQDILAKAERDGTARRTHGATGATVAQTAAAPMAPGLDGTATIHPMPFVNVGSTASAAAVDSRLSAAAAQPEIRTASATLHPALIAAIEPHSAAAEEYRAVRARLTQRDEMGPLRTILITSPSAGDGKSITAANLALTMAQEFQRTVLLVDANLRNPSVHDLFGIDPGPGLADVLTGEATLEDALVHLPEYRLALLPAGATTNFPTELLGSTVMRRALDMMRSRFDRILLDMPAVTPLADVGTVAPQVDGTLMVVRAGHTQRPALDEALAVLGDNTLVGVVMNDVI